MNLLIDTNIIIGLEDAGEVKSALADLQRKSGEYRVDLFVHEASKRDVARDANAARRRATLSRLKKFRELSDVSVPAEGELAQLYGPLKKPNDHVDAILLDAVANDIVDFLVTEDDGLHRRARRAGLADRTFTVFDALAWIEKTFEPTRVFLPAVLDLKAHGLDRKDPIFDELRADYGGAAFDAWLKKCVQGHRDCWVVQDGGKLAALIIRKDETHAEATTQHSGPKILKLCTFKVAIDHRGLKLGEQLLKQALWFAQRNRYDLVYVTTFDKQKVLIRLLEEYGFERARTRDNGEMFFEKPIAHGPLRLKHNEEPLSAARRHYPRFADGPAVRKFVVPILPAYHDVLFPESSGISSEMAGRPGNTILKVYLCQASTQQMRPGDIVMFYKTKSPGDTASQSITSLGIIESVREVDSLDDVRRLTGKRSVYSDEQLAKMVKERTRAIKIIDFLLAGHCGTPVGLPTLNKKRILDAWPQSIMRLSEERYQRLKPLLDLGFAF